MKPNFSVILVPSTHHAMKAESILLQAGVSYKLVPVPRHIHSDCGVCVRVFKADMERAKSLLKDNNIDIEGSFDL